MGSGTTTNNGKETNSNTKNKENDTNHITQDAPKRITLDDSTMKFSLASSTKKTPKDIKSKILGTLSNNLKK